MINITWDCNKVSQFPALAVDVETTGLYWYKDSLFGIAAACYDPEQDIMMSGYWAVRETPEAIEATTKALIAAKKIVNHNMKFDAHFLREAGVQVPLEKIECTMVRAALIDPFELSFSLDALSQKYLGAKKETEIYNQLAEMFGGQATRSIQIKNLHRAPSELVSKYARVDAELAVRLWHLQNEQIEKLDLHQVWALEKELMLILIEVEHKGVAVNVRLAEQVLLDVIARIEEAQRNLDNLVGNAINYNSPLQMRELFHAEQDSKGDWYSGTVKLEVTKVGNPSLNADTLRNLAESGNSIASSILELRKYARCASFLKDHILGHQVNGIVHPNFNQCKSERGTGTMSGRLSIDHPALQQIPSRDEEISEKIRCCFIPFPGENWLSLDYSQFEVRVFAHFMNLDEVNTIYANNPNTDFHQMVADLTGVPRTASYGGQPNAKTINLALLFGSGEGAIARTLGMPFTVDSRGYKQAGPECKAVLQKYHEMLPGIKQLLARASTVAKTRGDIRTIMRRRIPFPQGQGAYKAGALLTQGSSADAIKVKMIELYKFSKEKGFNLILSVHDELDFSIPEHLMTDELINEIKHRFTTYDGINCPIKLRIPITCQSGIGDSWHAAGH